ncbi:hypothetical protein ASG11_13010 [Sphingomonas sp. Leaf357]|uniref:DUF2147 domain-containing protein n=1 Tax=Sphingomonas sp. Leaf357 TaxID=1736350 RepID=UPI0007022E38|nr:DUF2147 domain-containing protein [Sphingomonas sp. Leaf357]KQS01758.1 hypothetical protein ASG11_13010 [Sphingomonas sp. Leaf357]
MPGAPSPVGRWITQDGAAIIAIGPCGGGLCGRIARILRRDPGAAETDVNNPDPRLRHRRADSVVILAGFVADGARWRGQVYDPRSGRTYRSFIATADGRTLDVRGCVLMFCQSQTWRRDRGE